MYAYVYLKMWSKYINIDFKKSTYVQSYVIPER